MRTNMNKEKRNGKSSKILTALLILVMLIQTVSLPAAAVVGQIASFGGSYGSITTLNPSGISSFDSKEVTEQLRQDFLSSLRKDLVMRIDEQELTGYAELIITFSDDSLITEYSNSSYSTKMTYNDYKKTSTARKFADKLTKNLFSKEVVIPAGFWKVGMT